MTIPHISLKGILRTLAVCAVALSLAGLALGQSQSDAADVRGYVRDPKGATVAGATVTVRNPASGFSRDAATNSEGYYQIVNVPPGEYEVSAQAANFPRAVLPSIRLTVGQRADLDIPLQLGQVGASVTVSGATTDIVETSRTAVSTTIDQQRIDNLPINERNYLSFALTTSTVTRDNGRPIGPAPTTGLNFGGQRGRSNLVQVDGADNTDNSVNASRSTVSQEAVQEFQVVTNSYAPEFGRSAGGVVNVVTKSGTNDLHGDAFGFLRNKRIQARNPFSPIIDNTPGKKAPFTRTQYGGTLGGTLDKDRTFFFFAFEQRRRNESGFFTSDVSSGLNGSVTIPAGFIPGLPVPLTLNNLTPQQASFISGNLVPGNPLLPAAIKYALLASSGGSTGLTGFNPIPAPLFGCAPLPGLPPVVASRFALSCTPVPVGTTNAAGQLIAFRPLLDLQRVFPVTERTTYNSFRLDHLITKDNQMTFRFGYNPSEITGIQVESQNQSLGQNDFSRTGVQHLKDSTAVVSLTSTLSNRMVNEARFNFGERRATFKSENGDAVAFNIPGAAFIGRELFSPVLRTETRYQTTDNLNIIAANHTLKFGGDINFIRIPSAIFELNFAGLYNFGGLSASTLGFPSNPANGAELFPAFTPVQQYGLGFPSNFIQGFGNPVSSLTNKPVAFFGQDSWKIRKNLTINYGVRYDLEIAPVLPGDSFSDPLSGITLSNSDIVAAQDALNVRQGFPHHNGNFSPRFAVAWDIKGNGKTVVRAAYGIFYDHPLLAISFNSDIADAAQQQQGVFLPNSPSQTALLNATQIFQGTVCVPGAPPTAICPAGVTTPGVAAGAQYQFGRQRFNDQTFPGFGPVLPFTLPVSKDFVYAYANQANFTIERQLSKDMALSASYLFVGAHHLPHPEDINAPNNNLLIANFVRFAGRQPINSTEASAFSVPLVSGGGFQVLIPGILAVGPRGSFVAPAAANFFRPNAPNYFLVQALTGGAVTPAVFNNLLAATGSLRTPGVVSPFGAVNAQVSDGNSNYNALNIDLKKRFSHNFQFLASYTWSHSIDDSSDLQTLLLPQDNRNFRAERADSLFDQRHRFVFSGIVTSPGGWRNADNGLHRFLADFTLAPILEISSGRPFNIISGVDSNNDQSNQTDRPSVGSNGMLFVPPDFSTGNLGRNRGITHKYASLDMRLTRAVRLGERVRIDVIAEGFNLFNRFNEAAASPLFSDVNAFNQRDGSGRFFSQPTAAFDPRQFQFGLKVNF